MPTLADLVGEAAAAEIISQADLELRALLERHRRAGRSGDAPAPKDDDQDEHRRREADVRR